MAEAMERYIMGKFDSLANLVMGLIGTPGVAAAEWIGRRAADIAVFMPDSVKLLFYLTFG